VSPELPGKPIEHAEVTLKPWFTANIPPEFTDEAGVVEFRDLLSGKYAVSAMYNFDSLNVIVGSTDLTVRSPETAQASISMYASKPGLKINELYTVGPPNDEFYFYDQFIELYNSANDTAYLDGMVVCRLYGNIDNVTYMFQFPGTPVTGRQYPVLINRMMKQSRPGRRLNKSSIWYERALPRLKMKVKTSSMGCNRSCRKKKN